jgi:hypothetical protein
MKRSKRSRICAYIDDMGQLYCLDCLYRFGRLEEACGAPCGAPAWFGVYNDALPHCQEPCEGCGCIVGDG